MKWVIQTNLSSAGALELVFACNKVGVDWEELEVIPFDSTLPNINADVPTLFYGGTNFVTNVWRSKRWNPGAFFDEENFTFASYLKYWDVLNSEAKITTFDKLSKENIDPDSLVFIRPNKDLKEFAGDVIRFKDLISWQDKLSMGGGIFDGSCEIVISEPYGIADEWRIFIAEKEPITGSHYRSYGRLYVKADVPKEVFEFAKKQADKWSPASFYALDIGRSGEGLYVIEANCINSAGFYASDIEVVVKRIKEFLE